MTPENAKALLPIITAFAEGKTIQRTFNLDPNSWEDLKSGNLSFEYPPSCYRIKPEPKKPTLRWYSWEELCALHMRGRFLLKYGDDIAVGRVVEKLFIAAAFSRSSTYIGINSFTNWQISFDNINWCPLGVVEQ